MFKHNINPYYIHQLGIEYIFSKLKLYIYIIIKAILYYKNKLILS